MVDNDKIAKNQYGKPYFSDNDKLHFNISHSKSMGVIVIDDMPCGVDVELIRDIKISMAKRFFTAEETAWIENADGREQQERFFKVWTGKEAYTKMLGCGLTKKMNSFNVLSDEISSMLEYTKTGDYLICVCSEGKRLSL